MTDYHKIAQQIVNMMGVVHKDYLVNSVAEKLKEAIKSERLKAGTCPNCGSIETVEFLNRKMMQCQICEQLWKL